MNRKMKNLRTSSLLTGIAVAMGLLAFSAGLASAKEQMSLTSTDPLNLPFERCKSSGALTRNGDKFQIEFKKLTGLRQTDERYCTGDEYICVVRRRINYPSIVGLDSYVVLKSDISKSEANKGTLKMEIEIPRCGKSGCTLPYTETDMTVTCYEPDARYFAEKTSGVSDLMSTYYDGTKRRGTVQQRKKTKIGYDTGYCTGEHHARWFSPLPPSSKVIAELGHTECN